MTFDLNTFAGITAATTAAVQGLKMKFPAYMDGRENLAAFALPLLLGVVSKLSGAFPEADWSNFVIILLLSGMTSQVAYDKVIQPLEKPKDETGKA